MKIVDFEHFKSKIVNFKIHKNSKKNFDFPNIRNFQEFEENLIFEIFEIYKNSKKNLFSKHSKFSRVRRKLIFEIFEISQNLENRT